MKLSQLQVTHISLVRHPANRRSVILRAQDSRGGGLPAGTIWFPLVKADPRWRRLYGIVYAPNETDAQGDWTDAETIRRAADDFLRAGRTEQVDREHEFEPLPAFVAESWLVRAGDPLFPEETEGAWAVGIQIDDPNLWTEIEAGEVAGLSLAGLAALSPEPEPAQKKTLWHGFRAMFRGVPAPQPSEMAMTADEVRALVREVLADTRKSEAAAAEIASAQARAERLEQDQQALRQLAETMKQTVQSLKADLEQLKAQPVPPAGASTGTPGVPGAPPAASFV